MQTPRLIEQPAEVEVIRSYEVLDTAKEQGFDDFAVFAARICQTPMAFIAFPDGERFWFKSSIGVSLAETPRSTAFCSYIVDTADYFSVNDTSTDERFSTHPFVVSEPHIRFYAGVPLLTSEGIVIGALSVADRIPRELSPEQKDSLWILSRQIISRLELCKQVASLSHPLNKFGTMRRETPARNSISKKKIKEELQESEAHHRIVAEMASDGIVTIDANSTILYANRATGEIFGYTAAELIGACLTVLMPERLRHFHEAGMRRFIETREKKFKWRLVEIIGRHKNGEEFPVEISFGEHLEDGRYYFTGVIRDVSERRRIANALRESEERFRQLAEHIDEVFWLTKTDTNELLYISPGYAKIWGRTLESLYGARRSWHDAVHPKDAARIREAEILKQPRGDYDEEYRIVQPDGSIRWIRDRAFPIKNKDGEVYRIAGVAADITARKLLEMRLTVKDIVTQELAKSVTLTEAMPRILQAICENFDWTIGALWIVDNDTDEIYCAEIWQDPTFIADEFIAASHQARYRRNTGFPSHVWTKDSLWVEDIADDDKFPRSQIAAKEGLHGAFGFPIWFGQEVLGVMEFFSQNVHQPDENLIAVTSIIGSQIGQFVARRRAEEALQQATVELESKVLRRTAELGAANRVLQAEIGMRQTVEESRVQLLHRLVGAQEEERGRIARELHDKMGQYLTGLVLGLHSLNDICQPHPPSHKPLVRLLQITDELIREVHHLAWELRPALLDDLGLNAALGNYLTQWSERNGIALDFHSGNLDKQLLSPDIETTVYRIVQEALTNILKHARANNVSVVLECQQNNVQVMVEDDGKGFDTEKLSIKATTEGRLGVVGMKERAAMVGGTLDIESTPGAGTTVFVRIPLPLAAGGNADE